MIRWRVVAGRSLLWALFGGYGFRRVWDAVAGWVGITTVRLRELLRVGAGLSSVRHLTESGRHFGRCPTAHGHRGRRRRMRRR